MTATTMAAMVRDIRNLLEDRPHVTQLNGAINTSVTAMTVDDASVIRAGVVYEFDDGSGNNAEAVYCDSSNTLSPTIRRAWEGTTVASHSDNVTIWVNPLYRYNKIAMAVNQVLNNDLMPHLYDVVEHTVTTSATTNHYNAPATTCEFILNIYQDLTTSTTNEPMWLDRFEQYKAVPSTLFSNAKFFVVHGGVQDGTQSLYVNCAEPLVITTLLDDQQDVVKYLAAARLLEWADPKSTGDQNMRKAQVGDRARLARYFREEGTRMLKRSAARLQKFAPPRKEWLPRRPRLVS